MALYRFKTNHLKDPYRDQNSSGRRHKYGNKINTGKRIVILTAIIRKSDSAFHCTAALCACCFVVTTFMVCLFFSLLPLRLYGMGGEGGGE